MIQLTIKSIQPKHRNITYGKGFISFQTDWGTPSKPDWVDEYIYKSPTGIVYHRPGELTKRFDNLDQFYWEYEIYGIKPAVDCIQGFYTDPLPKSYMDFEKADFYTQPIIDAITKKMKNSNYTPPKKKRK